MKFFLFLSLFVQLPEEKILDVLHLLNCICQTCKDHKQGGVEITADPIQANIWRMWNNSRSRSSYQQNIKYLANFLALLKQGYELGECGETINSVPSLCSDSANPLKKVVKLPSEWIGPVQEGGSCHLSQTSCKCFVTVQVFLSLQISKVERGQSKILGQTQFLSLREGPPKNNGFI